MTKPATIDLTDLVCLGGTDKHQVFGRTEGGEQQGRWEKEFQELGDGSPALDQFGDPKWEAVWQPELDGRGDVAFTPVVLVGPFHLVAAGQDSGNGEAPLLGTFDTVEAALESVAPPPAASGGLSVGSTGAGAAYAATITHETEASIQEAP